MGKLTLSQKDLTTLADASETGISVSTDKLRIDLQGLKLELDNLQVAGRAQYMAADFRINADYSQGSLNLDFE